MCALEYFALIKQDFEESISSNSFTNLQAPHDPQQRERWNDDLEALIDRYGDCTLRELVLKYVDTEIDRLMKASNDHLVQFSEELLKDGATRGTAPVAAVPTSLTAGGGGAPSSASSKA